MTFFFFTLSLFLDPSRAYVNKDFRAALNWCYWSLDGRVAEDFLPSSVHYAANFNIIVHYRGNFNPCNYAHTFSATAYCSNLLCDSEGEKKDNFGSSLHVVAPSWCSGVVAGALGEEYANCFSSFAVW